MKKQLTFAALLVSLVTAAFTASAQCGDSCITATPLVVTASGPCVYDSCSNAGATPSGVSSFPCSAVNNNDVWYTFTVPPGVTSLVAQVLGSAGGMTNPTIYAYRGSCASLASFGCSPAAVNLNSLIPGEQIWVRVKPLGGTPDGAFQICVFNPCPAGPPPNDDPCTATVVSLTGNCTSYTTVSNACAGNSAGIPNPACGNYTSGDVWVQTTVGASGQLVISFEQQTITDVSCAVYNGTCAALSLVACSDDDGPGLLPYLDVSLIPGSTAWIRIWSVNNLSRGTTGICIRDGCPSGAPPANDDPCAATIIPLAGSCTSFVSVSNVCATASASVPAPGCTGYAGDDIWVKTTSGPNGSIKVTFLQETLINVGAAIYTGTCSSLVFTACNDDDGPGLMPEITFVGIVPGADVWVRIWDQNGGDTGSVGICVSDLCSNAPDFTGSFDDPPCPMPDSASWYLPVTVGTCTTFTGLHSYCANPVFGTFPAGIPVPTACTTPFYPPGAVTGWDVWMPFIVPDTPLTGYINIYSQAGTVADLDMALYRLASPVDSACSIGSQYTLIICDEGSGPGFMPFIHIGFGGSNPTQPGDTLLLRMWDYFGGPTGNWGICINTSCPGGSPVLPAYDEPPCPASASLLPVTDGACNMFQQGEFLCATPTTTPNNPGCANWNNAPDVWYVVQMPVNGSGLIEFEFQTGVSSGDIAAAVYSGTPVACGGTGLTLLACDDDAGPGLLPYISLTNPVNPGEYLFIRIWTYGGAISGNFGLCVMDPCPGGTVAPPLFENPPCPMPASASSYLPVSVGSCPVFWNYSSACANPVFGNNPPGVPLPAGCSGPTYPPGAVTGWDEWAPIIVPGTPLAGAIDIRVQNIYPMLDLDMALYKIAPPVFANCGNGAMYSLLTCDDYNGPGIMPFLHITYGGVNLVQPGDTLLVRMWRHSGGATFQWSMSASYSALPPADLCIVTVDSATGKNAMTWDKPSTANIDSFYIYREGATPGNEAKIGAVGVNDPSLFIDFFSDPQQHDDRYKLVIKDSCSYESFPGMAHRSMHLDVTPGSISGWDLAWNDYQGFSWNWTYIYRGAPWSIMTLIDSVPALLLNYSDAAAPAGVLHYFVEVRSPAVCMPSPNPSGISYGASRSNVVAALGVGFEEDALSDLVIRPNPIQNSAEISFSLSRTENLRISIYDIAGREISLLQEGRLASGNHSIPWDGTDQSHHAVAGGLYFIKLQAGNFSATKRVVVLP